MRTKIERIFAKPGTFLEKFGKNTAFLIINGKSGPGSDCYLMIQNEGLGNGYHVNGVVGFGGLGYCGSMSTQSLVSGLNKLGFTGIDAKTLRVFLNKGSA